MRTYKDVNGVEHRLKITLATRQRLVDQNGVDLIECAVKPEVLEAFLTKVSDPVELFRVVATIEGCDLQSLLDSADLETQEAAGSALIEAIADFFPQSSPLKSALLRLVGKVKDLQEAAADEAEANLLSLIDGLDISRALSESTPQMSGSAGSALSQDARTVGAV